MRKRLLTTVCLVFTGTNATAALAQQTAVPADPETPSIADIIVTADRRSQSVQKSSLAISVLSPDDLRDGGVSQVRDIANVLPGVVIGQGGPVIQVYIRGIGDNGSAPNTNPAVATYIDGVYVARANSIEGNFYDVARVEVLKGPQGTLYGRNAAGGALNILTNAPDFNGISGALNLDVGSYDLKSLDGSINLPLSDKFAVRAAFQVVDRDGYSSQGFDDDKKQSVRLSMLWKPSDDVSLRVTGSYIHAGGIGPGYLFNTNAFPDVVRTQLGQLSGSGLPAGGVTVPTNPRLSVTDPQIFNVFWGVERLAFGQRTGGPGEVGPFNGIASAPFCLPVAAANGAMVGGVVRPLTGQIPGLCNALFNGRALPSPPGGLIATWDPSRWQSFAKQDNRYWNINAELNWNLGFANLTVIPSYRETKMDYATFPLAIFDNGGRTPETSKSKALEVRLSGDSKLLNWTVGAYYFTEAQVQNSGSEVNELQTGLLFNTINFTEIDSENYAFFGQASWNLSDRLRVITGLRYSNEHRTNKGYVASVFPSTSFVAGQACFNSPTADCITDAWDGSITFSGTNYKVGVEYDLTSENMLFATAATGTKAGGLNTRSIGFPTNTNPIPFDPEKLTAYELGSRNRFLNNRLQVNLEAFYWVYSDHQEQSSFTTTDGRFLTAVQNSGEATAYGADVSIVAQVTDNDRVKLNVEYNKSKYSDFTVISSGQIRGITTDCSLSLVPGSTTTQFVDCAGFPLVRAPEVSGSAAWTHTLNFANGGELDFTVDGLYTAKRYLSNNYTAQNLAPSYILTNLNATYRAPGRNWSVSAYARNLTNEVVYTGSFSIRGFNPSIYSVNLGPPRTYGVRFAVNF